MSQKLNMSESDRLITNKAISFTPKEKLVELFGEKVSYEIPNYLNINAISNKAFYKLNDEELFYLNARSTVAYKALKTYYTRRAESELGFDFNSNFGLQKNDSFNLQSLTDFEDGEIEQEQHIPLKQEVVDKIMSAKKFKVELEKSPNSKLAEYGRSAEYYLCEVDEQIVPVVLVKRETQIQNTFPVRYSQSISVFVLLKGKIPFFVSRLDFDPYNKHTNRLEDGKIATSKIRSRGTHQHIYTERFAVLVPTNKRIMHCDAETYDFISTFEDAQTFVKNQTNVSEKTNPELEQPFTNDIKKAHKQKKFNSPSKKFSNNDYNNFDFNL